MPLVSSDLMQAFSDLVPGLGTAVAVSADGKTAVMTSNSGVGFSGAVYTSKRVAGAWTSAQLLISDANTSDNFGAAVAVSSDGNIILVGEPGRSQTLLGQGAFVSVINGIPSSDFFASDVATTSAAFGSALAISYDGKTAVIGAPGAHGGSIGNTGDLDYGAAYIFIRSDVIWTQQKKLVYSGGNTNDAFGTSVSMSADGNTVVVGAPQTNVTTVANPGYAVVFTRSDSIWTQTASDITASDGSDGDAFGTSVAISADASTILVGAPNVQVAGNNLGKAYVFENFDDTWPLQHALIISDQGDADFGRSVTLSCNGNIALIGATAYLNTGAVFFFTRLGAAWDLTSTAQVESNATPNNDMFGSAVALSADGAIAVVGDPQQYSDQGSAYIYRCGYDIPNLPCFSCCDNSTPGPRGSDGAPGMAGPPGPQGLAGANLTAGAYLNQIILFALLLYGGFLLMFFTITFC